MKPKKNFACKAKNADGTLKTAKGAPAGEKVKAQTVKAAPPIKRNGQRGS